MHDSSSASMTCGGNGAASRDVMQWATCDWGDKRWQRYLLFLLLLLLLLLSSLF
jgi:hypothetical protein